jgi:hypothetical protein
MAVVEPAWKVTELELKQRLPLTSLQSKKPPEIIKRSRGEPRPTVLIPGNGNEARRANDPFRIRSWETIDVSGADPIAEAPEAVAWIIPPEIVKLKTPEDPMPSTYPDPIPAPFDPFVLIFPPAIFR